MWAPFLRVWHMIETVVSVKLPIDEVFRIKKNRLTPNELTGNEKRLCVVTGIHGDEVAGQYILFELIQRIKADYGSLTGIVDVYPACNPLALDAVQRGIPFSNLDMNTLFPGNPTGGIGEHIAYRLLQDFIGAQACVDVHSSNIFLREVPQVRINDDNIDEMLPLAKQLNSDLIWIHPSSTVKEGSLSFTLNEMGVKTVVIEAGVALQVDYNYCNQLIEGIFSLMKKLGIWTGETVTPVEPKIATDSKVSYVNVSESGTFIPAVSHRSVVKKGQLIGKVVTVITGSVEEELYAPCDGEIFSIREYPIVEEGSLIARILSV